MSEWLNGVVGAVVRLALWGLAALLALFLLTLALALLLLGALWAVVRGRKPSAPVFVGRVQRYAADQVWRGAMGRRSGMDGARQAPGAADDVVDVSAREVREPTMLPPSDTDPAQR